MFNALQGLFDLDRETAPAWTPSQRGALDLLPVQADERGTTGAAPVVPLPAPERDGDDPSLAEGAAQDTAADSRADSHLETRLLDRDEPDDEAVGRGELSDLDSPPDDDRAGSEPAAAATPAFLRRAASAARWQRPGVRIALAMAAVLLGLLLGAQAALWNRDALATRWPQAAPLLVATCEALGCRIEPLRHLDGLAVENSGLTQLDNPSQFRLQIALRNREAWPLLTPALDVTLTDNRGEIVARKVLRQSDFGSAAPATVAAGAELTLQAVFDAGDRRISGYNIEIFYP